MLAAIPYTTFPDIELGPLTIRTFGLMVGVGVLLGAWIAGRYIEANAGVDREESYRMATRLVIAGVVGARLTFVASHWEQVDSPLDIIAVWEGGLQFSGGFVGAIIFGLPFFRRWDRRTRWIALDGYAYGLSLGLAIGRIGCYSVGEHFGRTTDFFLGVRYDGGSVRESVIGDAPLVPGMVFHQTALYEFGYLLVLFAILGVLVRRGVRVGTPIAVFCGVYGVSRFATDSLRVNDETVLGLTGAQYFALSLCAAFVWIWFRVRPALTAMEGPSDRISGAIVAETATDAPENGEAADAAGELAGDGDVSERPARG